MYYIARFYCGVFGSEDLFYEFNFFYRVISCFCLGFAPSHSFGRVTSEHGSTHYGFGMSLLLPFKNKFNIPRLVFIPFLLFIFLNF